LNEIEVCLKSLIERICNEYKIAENVKRIAEIMMSEYRSRNNHLDRHMAKAALMLAHMSGQQHHDKPEVSIVTSVVCC